MRSNHLKQWKSFRIYSKPSKKLIAIEQKVWYWPAFFFTWFWSLLNRLWLVSVITIVIYFALDYFVGLNVFEPELSNFTLLFGWLLISVAFGLSGNEWKGKKLLERGFKLSTIAAENRKLAILQFKSESANEETIEPQESVISKNKDLIKRKIQESIPSSKKNKSDYADELKEAKALLDDDLINKEDYEKIKKKIIDDL